MKHSVLFVVLFAAFVTVCWADGYQLSGEKGGYSVVVTFPQARPVEGENTIDIAVKDANSRPVKGALVKVEYLMPSLPGKEPMMNYETTAKPDGDIYKATLNLSMKGEWRAIVTIAKGKQKSTITLPFEVK
jgi:hypothetical protein